MQHIRTIPVSSNGKHYEIRVFSDATECNVAGYRDGRQVTAGYGVKLATDFDFRQYHGEWYHDRLIAVVNDDITQGRVAP